MPTRGKKDPNGRALRGRRAYTTFISDPIAQIWGNYNVRSGAAGAATPEQPAVQNCLYDRFEALYKKSSIKPSLVIVPARFKSGTLYSEIPTSGAGDFTVTRTTTPTAGRSTRINKDGLIELVADNVPRLDYPLGGAVNGCPALLVEPAATNGIRNNSMVGAVAGTPGNLPTNWFTLTTGLTRTIVGTGTENGVQYIDIRFSGTSTATSYSFGMELVSTIAATSSQAWSNSIFFKVVSAPSPPTSYQLQTIYVNSGAYVNETNSTLIATTTLTRYSFAHTSPASTITNVYPVFRANFLNGQSYDFTIRIGYPQLELGSVATSVIPTTTGSVTRTADVISVSGAVSGSIGQTEGTMYWEGAINRIDRVFFALSSGTSTTQAVRLQTTGGGLFQAISISGTVQCNIQVSGAVNLGEFYKIAFAYKENDFVLYINGTQRGTDTSGTLPTNLNSIYLCNSNGTEITDQRCRAVALYTTRLTNAQLAAITQP